MDAFAASFFFFLLLYASISALYMARYRPQRTIADRFAELNNESRTSFGRAGGGISAFAAAMLGWTVKLLPRRNTASSRAIKLKNALLEAGYRSSASHEVVRMLTIALPVAMGLGGYWLISASFPELLNPISGGLLLAAAGFLLPTYYVRYRARARRLAIGRQLADALDLLVVSVEAGLGVTEAIKVVGLEADRQRQEIGREFSLVASDMSAGATMGEALRALAQRTAVEDMRPLATTLIQSEQLGSRIGPALRACSDALRERRRLRAEEGAHKMTIKMIFPLGLLVLPAMIMLSAGPALIQVFRILRH